MTTFAAAAAKAHEQHGLITQGQLLATGLSSRSLYRAVAEGHLVRVFAKVYRFSVTPDSWDLRAQAALMTAKVGVALSHASAAVLWGLLGYQRHTSTEIHLSVGDRQTRRASPGFTVHRPKRPFLLFWLNGFPVTQLARTIVDLAAELDERRLEQVLDQAHLRRPGLQGWLEEELEPLSPKQVPGVGTLKRLLAVRRGVAVESPLETDVRRVVRLRNLTEPTYQLEIHDEHGRIMRVDAAWEAHRIALHTDSYQWHRDRKTFDADAEKRRRLVAAGWASVAVTSTDLKSSKWLVPLEKLLHDRAPQASLFGFWAGKGMPSLDPDAPRSARRR